MPPKYNKYGADYKNIKQFDVETISDKDDVEVVFRIYDNKDEFLLFFTPNYEDKTIGVATDRDTKFSDAVLEFLIKSGDVENVMKQVYHKAFSQNNIPQPTELPKMVSLNLPQLNLPESPQYSLIPKQ
jgi:hypothetical protein